jgi:hypothetical protein
MFVNGDFVVPWLTSTTADFAIQARFGLGDEAPLPWSAQEAPCAIYVN